MPYRHPAIPLVFDHLACSVTQQLMPDDHVNRARVMLERRGVALPNLLTPEIYESWTRCLEAGLDPGLPPRREIVEVPALQRARDQHAVLYRLALAEMQTLYHQIAGSNFMIALAAPDGLLLEALSDASFGNAATRNSLQPGMLWTERTCGTNALGTVIATGRPISVHGPEHFFTRYGALTCVAAPIFGSDGTMIGVLDASSNCASRQSHTRALVGMAATQVENGLLRDRHRRDLLIAFHSRREYLFTLSAGLMAFSHDGLMLAANRQARFLLAGLPAEAGQHFEALFSTGLAGFMEGLAANQHRPLKDHAGSTFVALIENARPAAAAILTAAALPAVAARRLVTPGFVAEDNRMIEAELFGHAEGAFTGARRGGAPGLVAEADGGTLFLDEIGDMPLAIQGVLLRLLDDWTVRPVGGGKRRMVDVQLIAATNADLDAAVAAGQFRRDLLYRLNTVEIALPPLRERQDFAALARHLFANLAPEAQLSAEALASQAWPGNIRELISALTRLTLTHPIGEIAWPKLGTEPVPAAPPDDLRQAQMHRIRGAPRNRRQYQRDRPAAWHLPQHRLSRAGCLTKNQ